MNNPLPNKKNILYRIIRHPLCMPYNRLAIIVVLINIFLFQIFKNQIEMLNIILINFSISNLIRQHYVINFLFSVATSFSTQLPLPVRWALGKVYHFGGLQVGAFFSGTLWLVALTFQTLETGTVIISSFHILILFTMMIAALPPIRAKYHNQFEIIARFGGWISHILFWIQTSQFVGLNLNTPYLYVLLVNLISIILPWLRLKKVSVKMTSPSSHVVLADFNYGVTPFAGSSTELSLNPLLEWHSFANVPIPHREGFKLTISRAGDWTGNLIDQLPKHIWVKSIPTAGVGNIEKLFKKVVWVATGSGIGPCLPHLLSQEVPSVLVWSTRNPSKTYGEDLVHQIKEVQPNALIWDTDQSGKPDLVQLAYNAYVESEAEAIICISNKKVTWNVVYEMESRGIPAFGAIWDS